MATVDVGKQLSFVGYIEKFNRCVKSDALRYAARITRNYLAV